MEKATVRKTIVLPVEIAENLKRFVPARKHSAFIAEAVEQHLMRIIHRQGRERSFGAWGDDAYPHLRTSEDVRQYIAELRDANQWRSPENPQQER